MLPTKPSEDLGNEKVFKKLGKSLIANVDIRAGEQITLDHLSGRIFSKQFIPVRDSNKVLGGVAKCEIARGEPIQLNDIHI
jgi:N-acetylneuraminate synthase/sialic acid synthase